ncbi:hypothetical protein BZA02_10238 [Ruegeria sp. P4]|nr:hypothetical protein BZA02_10238 [Ruegeria sp. P4]
MWVRHALLSVVSDPKLCRIHWQFRQRFAERWRLGHCVQVWTGFVTLIQCR